MFGYVVPNQGELKVKELAVYQSYYCGLCQSLKKQYHFWGRLSLNYDMAFLGMLLTAVYEPEVNDFLYRCIAHPTKKHEAVSSEFIDYAADMNILMVYYKCLDDWTDDRKMGQMIYSKLLFHSGKKVSIKFPKKADEIKEYLVELSTMEEHNETDIDKISGAFGKLCATLFCYKEDEWKDELWQIGFYLGKFIYILDAYDDLEEDIEKNHFNPLKSYRKREDFDRWVERILKMMMAEVGKAFETLPVLQNVSILRNIIYSGVWNHSKKKRKR